MFIPSFVRETCESSASVDRIPACLSSKIRFETEILVTGIAEGAPVPSLSCTRVYAVSIGIVVGCRAVGDNPIYEASLNITHISVSTDCYLGCFFDLLIDFYLESQRPLYVQSPICVRVCSI